MQRSFSVKDPYPFPAPAGIAIGFDRFYDTVSFRVGEESMADPVQRGKEDRAYVSGLDRLEHSCMVIDQVCFVLRRTRGAIDRIADPR